MSQLQVTGDLKVKSLTGVLTASAGIVSSVPLGSANGVATLGTDGKVPSSQLPTLGNSYKGTWNAATNTPTIADGVGTAGDYYLVSTGGTWNGIVFVAGNTVIYSGSVWQKAGGGTGTVTSVALSAPAAFSVSGSPITGAGTLALAGAGTSSDYIKGDGTLGLFSTAAVATITGGASTITTSNLDASKALSSNASGKVVANTTTSTELSYLSGVTSSVQTQINSKQNTLTLTTTGTSGAATLVGATLNIPQYTDAYTGTVTSVAMTVPTGLSVSGSPITTSGTLAVSLASGYSIPTTAKQTQWDTAYSNRITSLTTSGSSGAATLVSNTLNIPNYTLAGLGGQPQLNGTGFVKASGTTISYDNSTYLTTSSAASTYLTISNASSTYLTISSASSTYLSISSASSTYFPFSGGTISGATTITALLTNYNTYNTQTSSYTLVLSDASKIVEMNVGSANTVTVPTNASVAFPIGTEITVMQYGAGNTTIVAASGVTIRSKDFSTRIGDQYTGATLIKRGTNEWYLIGNIQP